MNKSTPDNKRTGRSRHGIKWRMYAILIVFLGITVGIIWFFQVRMLSYFYQANKFSELENTALIISQELWHPENVKSTVSQHASDYNEDIWVCRINGGEPMIIVRDFGTSAPIESLDLHKLYSRTVENGGSYIALVTHDGLYSNDVIVVKDNFGDSGSFPFMSDNSDRLRAIYVTVKNVGEDTFMIVQSTGLTPVHAVTNTMRHQFLWIGIILSLVALLTAGLMSRVITKPIVQMNRSAKRLAKGEYGADFTVKGYREINELADTLNYASRELAKADDLQKELISNVSHDLRTPLTMIKGYGEVMRDIPGENTAENIQIIIDETTRLSELVNDMLDLSKIQSGTRRPEMQTFSLTQTVRDTMLRYERLTMQDGYNIEFNAERDILVRADRGMILQVVYNLINNAINYTGDDKRVSVTQTVRENAVRISVTDTGEGIAAEELELIWDRYYKVDKVHKRATVGTGLGLSIVKQVLEQHNAAYGVESEIGKGSTFWFELRIYKDSGAEPSVSDYIEADYEEQEKEQK